MGMDYVVNVGPYILLKKSLPKDFDVYNEFKETLCHPAADTHRGILISNIKGFDLFHGSKWSNPDCVNINPDDVSKVTSQFWVKFRDQISKLEEILGKDNVEVKFGVLSYYS